MWVEDLLTQLQAGNSCSRLAFLRSLGKKKNNCFFLVLISFTQEIFVPFPLSTQTHSLHSALFIEILSLFFFLHSLHHCFRCCGDSFCVKMRKFVLEPRVDFFFHESICRLSHIIRQWLPFSILLIWHTLSLIFSLFLHFSSFSIIHTHTHTHTVSLLHSRRPTLSITVPLKRYGDIFGLENNRHT